METPFKKHFEGKRPGILSKLRLKSQNSQSWSWSEFENFIEARIAAWDSIQPEAEQVRTHLNGVDPLQFIRKLHKLEDLGEHDINLLEPTFSTFNIH